MCNVSFATEVVPSGLKVGKITPVYKGNGNDRKDPASYLAGGRQCVTWKEETRPLINVMYGVWQGSILGPLLFLILMDKLPMYLGWKEDNVIYADDIDT
jgi:hypothetical protein